jgi:hypothetical protein
VERQTVAAVVAGLVLVVAGCSGGGDQEAAGPTSSAPAITIG